MAPIEKTVYALSALLIVFVVFGVTAGLRDLRSSPGTIVEAERVLKPGQVYECVTPLVKIASNNDDGYEWWYAIVKVEDKCFGLKFNREVSLKGVVANQGGTVVFIRINTEGVVISNPLPAENPAEK